MRIDGIAELSKPMIAAVVLAALSLASNPSAAADKEWPHYGDLPALTGPGLELVYAASWFMGIPSPGTMISGAVGSTRRDACSGGAGIS
jgi:hypothetical protein